MLDEALAELRGALRSEADVLQLESRMSALENLIKALDDQRQEQHQGVQALLETSLNSALELSLPRKVKATIRNVKKQLPKLLRERQQTEIWQQYLQVDQALTGYIAELQSTGPSSGGLFARLFSAPKPLVQRSDLEDSEHLDEAYVREAANVESQRAEPPLRSPEA
jgi:hypothetical protein